MAPLALLLCIVIVVFLLLRDSRRRPSVSLALWLPTLMVMVLSSRNPSLWLGQKAVISGLPNDVAGNILDQAFFFVVILASCLVANRRGVKWGRLFSSNTALLVFYAFFFISFLWSTDPSGSLKRLIKDFSSTVIVIAVILSEEKPLDALRAVYVRSACVLYPFSMLFIRYYPEYGRVYAKNGDTTFTGVTVQKNSLGEMVVVFTLFLIWDLQERRAAGRRGFPWDLALLVGIGAWLLKISESKTSLVCLLIGLGLTAGRSWLSSITSRRLVFGVALSLPFWLLLTQQFRSLFTPLLSVLGRDATFTGRADIWEHIDASTVNPIVGAGFWNFWGGKGGAAISAAMQTGVPNAHSGYLDIYLDGGLIGLVLLFLLLLTTGNRLVRDARRSRFDRLKFALLTVAVVVNLTESNFARPSLIWFTTVLALLQFVPLLRSKRRPIMQLQSEQAMSELPANLF